MKITMSWLLACCAMFGVSAQTFRYKMDTVDLGVVYENQPDSAVVYVKNTSTAWQTFAIDRVAEFPFYGDTVVHANYTNKLVVPNDSIAIWLVAQPEHNVKHKGSILLELGNSFGQLRIPYKFQGRYSKTYYNATENKTESALRTQLKSTISAGYLQLSYNSARDKMYGNLDNVNGDVECVYTGRTATFNTRTGANANSFNCEHTFPQGFFNSALPMKSDIHHLFSTDVTANSQRGSLPFGTVTNPSWQVGGSKKNSSTFEPRNAQKGATARAMMYFVLRYQDYSNHFAGQENILRQWHNQFLPNQQEKDRNDGIFQLQNNRNPFVDYPQFAERITNLLGNTSAPARPAVFVFDTVTLVYNPSISSTKTTTLYIYNSGNVPLQIDNFQFSGNLSFATGSGQAATLAAGGALPVDVVFTPSQDHTGESMTFTTNPTATGSQTIYFNSLVPQFSVNESHFQAKIFISNQFISWPQDEAEFTWFILDMMGRKVLSGTNKSTNKIEFNELANGAYLFTAQDQTGKFLEKFIVTNH